MAAFQLYTVTLPPFTARARYNPDAGTDSDDVFIHQDEEDPWDIAGLADQFIYFVSERTSQRCATAAEVIAWLQSEVDFEDFNAYLWEQLEQAYEDQDAEAFAQFSYQVAVMGYIRPLAPYEREAWMVQVNAGVEPVAAARALDATNT